MSEQTPCEKLGYEVGDRFVAAKDEIGCPPSNFNENDIIELVEDDGEDNPIFTCVGSDERHCMHLSWVKKIEPETTADAIERIDKGMDNPAPSDNDIVAAEHQIEKLTEQPTKKKYTSVMFEGQWVVADIKRGTLVPLHKIVNMLNER